MDALIIRPYPPSRTPAPLVIPDPNARSPRTTLVHGVVPGCHVECLFLDQREDGVRFTAGSDWMGERKRPACAWASWLFFFNSVSHHFHGSTRPLARWLDWRRGGKSFGMEKARWAADIRTAHPRLFCMHGRAALDSIRC